MALVKAAARRMQVAGPQRGSRVDSETKNVNSKNKDADSTDSESRIQKLLRDSETGNSDSETERADSEI